jgi:hypothetical protein
MNMDAFSIFLNGHRLIAWPFFFCGPLVLMLARICFAVHVFVSTFRAVSYPRCYSCGTPDKKC